MESARIKLSADYYKGKDNNQFYPKVIIALPKSAPELEGYVLKIGTDYVTDDRSGGIVLENGNEWDGYNKTWNYVFEKEVKERVKRFKRYRFNEIETYILYAKDKTPNFVEHMKRREDLVSSGTGKLIRARYTTYSVRDHCKGCEEGWFLSPDRDTTWVYPLDYNPLLDSGKHNKSVKGFAVLEEYVVSDIATLYKSKERLRSLLNQLDYVRGLRIKEIQKKEYYYDNKGEFTSSSSIVEALAYTIYNQIPDKITHEWHQVSKYKGEWHETPHGGALREELTALSEEMVRKCNIFIDGYKAAHIAKITEKIDLLTGIHISNK